MKIVIALAAIATLTIGSILPASAYSSCTTHCFGNTCTTNCY